MATTDELLIKYVYDIEINVAVDSEASGKAVVPDWVNSVTCEKQWKRLFDFNFDRNAAKEHLGKIEEEEKECCFQFGLACLIRFIQSNFTGPNIPSNIADFLNRKKFKSIDFARKLSVHNEDINFNTQYPVLLVAADYIFEHCTVSLLVNNWWRARLVFIHQKIINTLCPSLLVKLEQLVKDLETCALEGRIKALFETEIAQFYLLFRSISKAKDFIVSASKTLGLEFQLVGKLGKRTRHQEKDIAQLTIEASLEEKGDLSLPMEIPCIMPSNVLISDPDRLETIEFVEPTENIVFPKLEQKLFITIITDMMVSKPLDELQIEEVQPFIDFILNQRNTWTIRTVALLQRCKIEQKVSRVPERTFSQIEVILLCYKDEYPGFFYRIADVFGTGLGPIWGTQQLHGKLLLDAGLIRNSLEAYTIVKDWEQMILCHHLLNEQEKAAKIIRDQLEKNPTVKMWCLLGDATKDESCYEKAWHLSKHRSHIAQRHWGNFLYGNKEYAECIPHFEKSLSINPLQEKLWFRLGFAALQTENWQVCATAYRRYGALEPESFESWNNLAQAYIKLGNKRAAHYSLLEALKCNFDHWRVWENLLYVSCDLSCFSDVIRAYNRILDIKGKYVNVGVLNILVYSVVNNVSDADSMPASRFLQNTRELLGRVTAAAPNDAALWDVYSLLAPNNLIRAQRLQRSYRSLSQSPAWFKDLNSCAKILKLCQKIAQIVCEDDVDPADPIVNSVRLNLNCVITAVKKENFEECNNVVDELITLKEKLVAKIQKGQKKANPISS